jgi:DNA-binding transcriptional regulator YiaG
VTKKTNYRNRRLETLHKTATALHRVDALDKATMCDVEAFCLTSVEALSDKNAPAGASSKHKSGRRHP